MLHTLLNMSTTKKFDLEDRLVKYAGEVINFVNSVKKDIAGQNLSNQIIRSSISSALNYGEAQAAESRKDFIHKNKIVLKELKETRVNFKILTYINYGNPTQRTFLYQEGNELVAIFATILKNTKLNSK